MWPKKNRGENMLTGWHLLGAELSRETKGKSGICCQNRDRVRYHDGGHEKGPTLGDELNELDELDGLSSGEQAAVNGVHNGLGGDLLAAEETTIEALDGIFTTLDAVELQVDVSLGVGI